MIIRNTVEEQKQFLRTGFDVVVNRRRLRRILLRISRAAGGTVDAHGFAVRPVICAPKRKLIPQRVGAVMGVLTLVLLVSHDGIIMPTAILLGGSILLFLFGLVNFFRLRAKAKKAALLELENKEREE